MIHPPVLLQHHMPHRGGVWTVSEFKAQLGLTDWQANQITAIIRNVHQGAWRSPAQAKKALWRQVFAVLNFEQQARLRTFAGRGPKDLVEG